MSEQPQLQAGFFDVNNNGVDIADINIMFVVVGALIAAWMWTRKRIWIPIRRSAKDALITQIQIVVRDELTEFTKPIQPHANGGKSLPDVASNTDWANAAIVAIAAHVGVELPPMPRKSKEQTWPASS